MTQRQGAASVTVPACSGCGEPFGAAVEFCPFCGVTQRSAPAAPEPVTPLSPSVVEPLAPDTSDAEIHAKADAGQANPAGDREPAEPAYSGDPGQPPTSFWRKLVSFWHQTAWLARSAWRYRKILLAAAVILLAARFVVPALVAPRVTPAPTPTGTVTVMAILPNGKAETRGTVLADGHGIGAPGVPIAYPAGTVVLGYALPGWSADEQRATIAAGVNSTVRLSLQPLLAHVSIVSSPSGADLSIDGRAYGRTPANVTLSEGHHELTVSLKAYAPKSTVLSLERGETRRVDFDLTPASQPSQMVPPPFDRGVTTGATTLRSAPSQEAEAVQTIDAGLELPVAGQVMIDGQRWLATRNSDGRVVYLSPDSQFVSWPEWKTLKALSGTISGVLRGYRFVVGSRTVTLYGIRPPDVSLPPAASEAYEKSLNRLGGFFAGRPVQCEPYRVRLYTCFVDHRDVAELFLLNGAAVVDTDTTPEYIQMQRQAAENHRGWAQ